VLLSPLSAPISHDQLLQRQRFTTRQRQFGANHKRRHNTAMPNLALTLKAEIVRVARKVVRAEVAALKKATSTQRAEIASLKRRAEDLEQNLRQLTKARSSAAAVTPEAAGSRATLFSAKSLASQRKRLGLSAADCGLLIGASGQSVYNWETGSARPQDRHLGAIAALRSLGRKEAAARLLDLRSKA